MIKKRTFPFLLILVTALCFTGCGKKEEKMDPYAKARPVRTLTLEGGGAGVVRSYPGKTEAKDTVDASFEVSGKIIELPISRGMPIAKGQIIAKLDPRDFENDLSAREAEFVKAEAELNRYRDLYEDDAVSLQDLEIKERDLNVAEANMLIARKAFQDTVLKAPFAGVVAKKYVENFQSVLAKEEIARIQNNEEIEVVIYAPERDMAIMQSAELKQATGVFDAFPGREFTLTFQEAETEADAITQTFKIKFILPRPEGINLLPGMSTHVTLQFTPKAGQVSGSSFLIPSAAVMPDATGRSHVWVVSPTDSTVHKREVEVGEVAGTGEIQVLSGLKAGETIAVAAIRHLREGMKIVPREEGMKITE